MKPFKKLTKIAAICVLVCASTLPTTNVNANWWDFPSEILTCTVMDCNLGGGLGGSGGLGGIGNVPTFIPLPGTGDGVLDPWDENEARYCEDEASRAFVKIRNNDLYGAEADLAYCAIYYGSEILRSVATGLESLVPTINNIRFDTIIAEERYRQNNSIDTLIPPYLLSYLNSAADLDSDLNKAIYKLYYKMVPLGSDGLIVPVSNINSQVAPVSEGHTTGHTTQNVPSSNGERTQIDTSFPLQTQVILNIPSTRGVPTSFQARIGFPLRQSSEVLITHQDVHSSWTISDNKGYFFVTIAVELGTNFQAVPEIIQPWMPTWLKIPQIAEEVNLSMKCSTTEPGSCQIQSIALQTNFDLPYILFDALFQAYTDSAWVLTRLGVNSAELMSRSLEVLYQGYQTSVARLAALLATPAAELETIEGSVHSIVSAVSDIAEDLYQETAVAERDTVFALPGVGGPDYVESLVEGAARGESIPTTILNGGDSSAQLDSGITQAAETADELVADSAENTVEGFQAKFNDCPLFLNAPLAVGQCFLTKGLMEIQIGVTWLNPDVAAGNNNTGYRIHALPDYSRIVFLAAVSSGMEMYLGDRSDIDKFSFAWRARFFPNVRVSGIFPFGSALGKAGLPAFTGQ
jgi:hypothetical protein